MEQLEATLDNFTQPVLDQRAMTPPTRRAQQIANLLVIGVLIIALLLGWWLMVSVESRTSVYSDPTIRFAYPAGWVAGQDADGNPLLRDPQSASQLFNSRIVIIHSEPAGRGLPGSSPLAEAATAWTLGRSASLDTFRNLSTEDGYSVAGQPAIRVDYAYVADPAASLGRPGLPIVIRGSDLLILTGDTMTVLAGQTRSGDWAGFESQFLEIVAGATLTQGGS